MLIGYNNDVEYRDKKFHIQTEDHGTGTAKIESQIFHEGQILDTEIIDYDSVLDEHDGDEAEDKVKSLMWQTHKGLYERLVSGEYDERVGLEPLDKDQIDAPDPDEFEPGQDRVPTAAKEIEEKGEDAVKEFHESQAQRHTNLDNLKDHLEDVDEEEVEEEADADEEQGEDDEAEVEASELDGSLADIGEEIGGDDPNESSVVVKENDSKTVVESRPPEPSNETGARATADTEKMEPETIESDAIEPAGNALAAGESQEGRDSTVPAPTETEESPMAPNIGDEPSEPETGTAAVTSGSEAGSSAKGGDEFDDIPTSGKRAWRGCEDPEGLLSIVPLVEAYLGS